MSDRSSRTRLILSALLAGLFLLLGTLKVMGHPFEVQAFLRWGYPAWFRLVTGVLELGVAGLLLWPRTRLWGALLYAATMGGALVTHLRAGELKNALLPLVLLAVSLLLANELRHRARRTAPAMSVPVPPR